MSRALGVVVLMLMCPPVAQAQGPSVVEGAVLDFGPNHGTWLLDLPGVTWTPLHALSPHLMAAGDTDGSGVDELLFDFGPPYGVWMWLNKASWVNLHSLSPLHMTTADLDGNGHDEVILDFGNAIGIWVRYNNTTWVKLHALTASRLAVADVDGTDGDDLIISFTGQGIWMWFNNSSWIPLSPASAGAIVSADLDANGQDDIVVDFGAAFGIWIFWNGVQWSQLHTLTSTHLATGNVDGDLRDEVVIDFGPSSGIWLLRNGSAWSQLHALSSEGVVVANLDTAGGDDVLVDFGAGIGLWILLNDTTWVLGHPFSPQSIFAFEASSPPAVNLLTNGSLEGGPAIPSSSSYTTLSGGSTAIPGWVVTGSTVDYIGTFHTPAHGLRMVDLDGAFSTGGIRQTFATSPGARHVVTFDLSGNPEGNPVIKQVRVTVGGVTRDYSFDTAGQSRSSLHWKPVSFTFVATAATSTLTFSSLSSAGNSWGAFIDHVIVAEQP